FPRLWTETKTAKRASPVAAAEKCPLDLLRNDTQRPQPNSIVRSHVLSQKCQAISATICVDNHVHLNNRRAQFYRHFCLRLWERTRMRDPYKVLGIPRSARSDAIKRRFRQLAKRLHPDAHANDPGASARFSEVVSAYRILHDETTRKA